jgi:Protein of unknown function (DUF4031)
MTVYVHKLPGQGRALLGRTANPDSWFVLTADAEDELHAFAANLGLTRIMFRPGTPARRRQVPVAGHYDVTLGERDRAMALGAQEITPQEAARMEQQRAAGLGYG